MAKIKNVLSFVLVFAMLLTMASFPAFADEIPSGGRAAKSITLVRNETTGLLGLPADVTEVMVGDTLTIPYVSTTYGNPYTLNNENALVEIEGTKYGIRGDQRSGSGIIGTIGGTTYAVGNLYINSQADEYKNAKGLTFEVTETGTYQFYNKGTLYLPGPTGSYWTNATVKDLVITDDIVVTKQAGEVVPDPAHAKKTVNLVYDADKNMYTVPEGVTVRVGDTIKWDYNQMFTWTTLATSATEQAVLMKSGMGVTHIGFDKNGDDKFSRTEAKVYSSYKWPDEPSNYSEGDLQVKAGNLVITKTGTYIGARAAWSNAKNINVPAVGDTTYVNWYDGSAYKNSIGIWLESFTVTETADDYAEVAPTSSEVLDKPVEELLIGENATEFTLNFEVKMNEDVEPEFEYSVTPKEELITRVGEGANGGFIYTVDAKFSISGTSGDKTTVRVTWGDNFRCEVCEFGEFTRELSDEIFGAEFLEGENRLTLSQYVFSPTSSEKYTDYNVLFTLKAQNFIDGKTTGTYNGEEYTNLKINFTEIESTGLRFNAFTAEDFIYNEKTGVWEYLANVNKAGIDQFFATLELVGKNTVTGRTETLETLKISSDDVRINEIPPKVINPDSMIGTKYIPELLAQLEEKFKNSDYVIVDCTEEYLKDINGKFVLEQEVIDGELQWEDTDKTIPKMVKVKNLAYRAPGTRIGDVVVNAELWNGLIHMNKSYIEFKLHTKPQFSGRYDDEVLRYSVKIPRTSTSMLLQDKEELLRIGMYYGASIKDAVTEDRYDITNSLKEQLGYGVDPLQFRLGWWLDLPFTDATVTIQLPEDWVERNGSEGLTIYRYKTYWEGGATLLPFKEDIAVNNRFDNEFELTLSGKDEFYANYVIIGSDNTVERIGDKFNKYNAATGGADLVATFATFAGIALAAYALKKRED